MSNWYNRNWIVLDVETTGLAWNADRVTEIAAITKNGESFHHMVNPGFLINGTQASELTGITDEQLSGQPSFAEIAMPLLEFVSGTAQDGHPPVVIAYNAAFDAHFVAGELMRAKIETKDFPKFEGSNPSWIDPLVWVRRAEPYARGVGRYKLGNVAERWGIEVVKAHRALGDVKTTQMLVHAMYEKGKIPATFEELLELQAELKSSQDFEYWVSKRKWKSERSKQQ